MSDQTAVETLASRWPVDILVLAAGSSQRMGPVNKLCLPSDGVPMVRRVAMQALASQAREVFVVLGYQADMIADLLDGLALQQHVNVDFAEGLGASVRRGAQCLRGDAAVLICLGDMPDITTPVMNAMMLAYQQYGDATATPGSGNAGDASRAAGMGIIPFQGAFLGQPGMPVLWSAAAIPLLRQCAGDQGARGLLRQYASVRVLVELGRQFDDIDTPDDYRRHQSGM